jgi:predicted O-methyltransferase YrrM
MRWSDLIFESIHWVKHRWRSRIRHGVHSPFVFGLQDGALKEAALKALPPIEKAREALHLDLRAIKRTDLGAGSRRGSASSMRIADIARKSLQGEHPARILRGLADALNAKNILELGTALGITTAYLSWDRPMRKVHTIEGDPALLDIAREQWAMLGCHNVQGHQGAFDEVLKRANLAQMKFDLILIDGNHAFEPTMRYWDQLKHQLNEGGCIVLDDIYWSPDMHRAWTAIKSDPLVTLTLDYFEWGIVFVFPRKQTEHYCLRLPTMRPRTRYY